MQLFGDWISTCGQTRGVGCRCRYAVAHIEKESGKGKENKAEESHVVARRNVSVFFGYD